MQITSLLQLYLPLAHMWYYKLLSAHWDLWQAFCLWQLDKKLYYFLESLYKVVPQHFFCSTSLWFIFNLSKLMLFPILLIWIQFLLQKNDLFLWVSFTLLFKQVVVHFCGFSSMSYFPPFSQFTIETGHSILEILNCEALYFNFKSVFHTKFSTFLCTYEIALKKWYFVKITWTFVCFQGRVFSVLKVKICICSSQMFYFMLDILTYILLDCGHLNQTIQMIF